jgi:hypothetical protein
MSTLHVPIDRLKDFLLERVRPTEEEGAHLAWCPWCAQDMVNAVLKDMADRDEVLPS